MLTIRNALSLLVGVVPILIIAASPPTLGQTPPGQQKIRISFNTPKRPDSNPYYLMLRWRSDEGRSDDATGFAMINGPGHPLADTGISSAKKITDNVLKAIYIHPPVRQGASVRQLAQDDSLMPAIEIENSAGFTLIGVIAKDGSNASTKLESLAQPFGSDGSSVSIDVFGEPAGGSLQIRAGERPSVRVATTNSNPEDIEMLAVQQLNTGETAASLATSALVSDPMEPTLGFDGSEIRFPTLQMASISVATDDLGLGIIARLNLGDSAAPAISFYQWAAAAGVGVLLLIASLVLFARWRERRMRRRS
ncbi:MAG: hypothetical protein ACREXR_03685 [Gammaproteobacteria bacterium]